MKFFKIESSDSKDFYEAWKIYESSFPSDERRALNAQMKLMSNKLYKFLAVYENRTLVGIITEWSFQKFLFVEHLAVRKDLRGKGIGTRLLKNYLCLKNRKIVLEVERPETEIAIKRIRFYEKIGFKLNKYDYVQPSYGRGKKPIPIFLMTYPETINEAEFSSIREKIHKTVYGLEKPLLGNQTSCV